MKESCTPLDAASVLAWARKEFGQMDVDDYRGVLMCVITEAERDGCCVYDAVRTKMKALFARRQRMVVKSKYHPPVAWETSGRRVHRKPVSSDNLSTGE